MAPVKISDRPGSIAGFDVVVSISEEAVNGQLLKLYKTPLTEQRLIPPSKLKNFKPLPASKHLINHQLSLHLLNKSASTPEKPVYRKTGIDSFIDCPKVRFRPEEYDPAVGNAVDKYKKAYLEIKFKRDDVTGKDSTLVYYDQDKEENATLVLNDCTMVWGVKIGRKDVENVLKDIIEPAKDSSSPAATDGKVTAKLDKYLDSQIFTVSTIFCLFEEKSMADSFILLGPDRKPVHGSALTDARHNVTLFFADMADQWKDNNGTPYATTENPFILGYGISQKKVAVDKIAGPGISNANTPAYFQPIQVAMSATPGEVKSEWMCTSGTLNYCLLTHRDSEEGHTPIEIDEADLNAGVITKTFFDITKTMGRTLDKHGNTQGHDGIMAFSKGIFSGLWLQGLAKSLILDPSSADYKAMISKGLQKESKDVTITLGTTIGPTAVGNGWELTQNWKTGMMDPPKDEFWHAGDGRVFVLGDCRVKITYGSDTSSIQSVEDGITHVRRILFDIEFENKWDFVIQNNSTIEHLMDNPDVSNNWLKEHLRGFKESDFLVDSRFDFLNACAVSVRTKSLVRVVMTSGVVGTWNIDISHPDSKNLVKKDEVVAWTKGTDENKNDYGNFHQLKNFYGYTYNGDMTIISRAVAGWGASAKDIIGDEVKDAFQGLTTTIIMPAGDVFTFSGLDTDEAGNVYAQANFANDGGFEVVKGGTQK
ncbi:hypothetical protein B0H63DRAFT_564577 [Podospora didyma]|uniref:Uncharacterized protein n=1 Tax=Podospora didyma TaxID=330526 RepID=A0AAE0K665_9PEZI|nr:hypothetical protein B0H63DRAFT_564577 [Podospora didyma]